MQVTVSERRQAQSSVYVLLAASTGVLISSRFFRPQATLVSPAAHVLSRLAEQLILSRNPRLAVFYDQEIGT